MEMFDKIQKLLNLADGNSFEGEANAALAKAHELMAKHNITMDQLDAAGREKELGKLGQWNHGDKAYKVWERTLMKAIAKLFDCEVVMSGAQGNRKKSMMLIGREGNVKTAQIMYNWIADKAHKDAVKLFGGRAVSKCNAYCVGIANEITYRVNQMKKQDLESGKGWCLVVVNEVKAYMRELYPALRTIKMNGTVGDTAAYHAGRTDGSNIGLNKQFGLKAIA